MVVVPDQDLLLHRPLREHSQWNTACSGEDGAIEVRCHWPGSLGLVRDHRPDPEALAMLEAKPPGALEIRVSRCIEAFARLRERLFDAVSEYITSQEAPECGHRNGICVEMFKHGVETHRGPGRRDRPGDAGASDDGVHDVP